jgi:hypothetical protein
MSLFRCGALFSSLLIATLWCGSTALFAQTAPAPAQPAAKPAPAKPAPAKPAQAKPAQAKPAAASPAPGAPAAAKPAPAKPAAAPAATGPLAGSPTLLGQFGDWGAYTASPGGRKVCFALSKPAKALITPPDRKRDQAYMFVSTRPSEKVKEEISLVFGYPLKPNADPSVDVGPANFAMYSQADGAWIKNAADETKMIETMRKSGDMVVKGESSRGTMTADTYSLKGVAQALDKIAQECP